MRSSLVSVKSCGRRLICCGVLLLSASGCPLEDTVQDSTSSTPDTDDEQGRSQDGGPQDGAAMDGLDADVIVELDAGTPQDGGNDAEVEIDPGPTFVPLMMCADLDARWGLAADGDRAATWANDISFAYAIALGEECRISAMAISLSEEEQAGYLNTLVAWTLQLFGCPSTMGDLAAMTYGLTETGIASVFTTADLELLSTLYVGAVEQAIVDVAGEPLPEDKLSLLRAQLVTLAELKPGVVKSDVYTRDTCSQN